MPSVFNIGAVNINTSRQNSTILVGESVITGMDANMKYNSSYGGTYGFFNLLNFNINYNFDSYELLDGVIYDQDFKGTQGGNI